jgi:hypothetical protein
MEMSTREVCTIIVYQKSHRVLSPFLLMDSVAALWSSVAQKSRRHRSAALPHRQRLGTGKQLRRVTRCRWGALIRSPVYKRCTGETVFIHQVQAIVAGCCL